MMDLKTCRFCGESNYEWNHPAANSAWVKYGTRANAHLQCALLKQGEAFLRKLITHQLELLPFLELQKLGMLEVVRDELDQRGRVFKKGTIAAGEPEV
jgi:hypothetical protein